MSKSLNQCNFIGFIGMSPILKALPNGDTVVNFSIACSDDFKNANGDKIEKTNWINVVAFRVLGDLVNRYCHKGSKVFVSGKQVTRTWQAEDGGKRYITEIIASDVQFLDSKSESNHVPEVDKVNKPGPTSSSSPLRRDNPQQKANPVDDGFDDDIPF